MTGNEVRQVFLDYFAKHHHQIVRSSSLIPQDDPTLLFTNAGMVQFKRTFLGEEKRNYNRATTSQKCVRAGGKHNDLENVGYTARHHTFFEMLGNFSFGDYFKEKAIDFAWDLLTNGYGLPAEKLWVSIYLDDDEAHNLWEKNVGVPADRIVRFGEADNFWSMGDTGPCGPCSEIHLDRGKSMSCGKPNCKLGCDCDRFLEIWNLVFMQFNKDESGEMTPLPRPSIDTGLGLERMAAIMQDVETNFDTDLIIPIIHKTELLSEKTFGERHEGDVAMKVIADHTRAAAFLISDGILPSNEGRGYVLRRIMRRAIRYGRNIGLIDPFLHITVTKVFEIMRPSYPELEEASAYITNIIQNEERRFSETLDKGLRLLNDGLADIRAKGETVVPGELIFKLYDTYGFPVDIVQDVVRDEGMTLDKERFDEEMAAQRKRSRQVSKFAEATEAYRALSSAGIKPVFTGYEKISDNGKVLTVVVDGNEVAHAEAGQLVEIVTDRTPFYGESGGQVGDKGQISAESLKIDITDTVKDPTGLIIHKGAVQKGTIEKDQTVNLTVDADTRKDTARNHTATHILHAVLRQMLGDHVKQAGSLVAPDHMRFDFTHANRLGEESLRLIEKLVNDRIRSNVMVDINEMDAEAAFKSGATALFEEKYGELVRVVALEKFSRELCGGTHTTRTGDIGLFKIIAESSVAAGIRRIEAVTGQVAMDQIQASDSRLAAISSILRSPPEKMIQKTKKLLLDQRKALKQIEELKAALAAQKVGGEDLANVEEISGIKTIIQKVSVDSPAALRDLADRFVDRLQSGIVVLGAVSSDKAQLIVKITKDLTDRYHAGKIVKEIAAVVGGSGGGRPDMAQAGGSQPENLNAALDRSKELILKA